MNTNYTSTIPAFPFDLFVLNKTFNTKILDEFMIINNVHIIFCPIPLIKLFYSCTWIRFTIVTKLGIRH